MATEDTTLEEGVSQPADQQQDAAATSAPLPQDGDTPGATEEPQLPPTQARRKNAMEAALAGRKKRLAAELDEARDQGLVVEEPQAEPEPTPQPTLEPGATESPSMTQPPAATAAPGATAEPMVIVKVNGVERQIPQSELVAGYQKAAGADQKFRDAAALRDEAQALLARTGAAPAATPAPTAEPARTEAPAAVSQEKVRKVVEAMQMGTAEEGEAALAALLAEVSQGRGDAATPDVNAIKSQVQDALRAEAEYAKALDTVGREYPDIFGVEQTDGTVKGEDPHLIKLAADEVHNLRASALIELGYDRNLVIHNLANDPREIKRVYDLCVQQGKVKGDLHLFRAAAGRVSDWDKSRRAPAQTAAPQPTTPPAATPKPPNGAGSPRHERKAALPQQPTPNSARAPIETGEKPPESKSAYVQRLRKVRGQA